MKGPTRRLRLSPNEEARIIKEEKERRRKLRLVQVREQAKVNAAKLRQAVKQERENQISILAAEIKDEWEEEKAEKIRKLQEIHLHSLRHVGDAHVNATQQEPTDVERALIEQENLQRAAQRHLEAIKKMKEDKKRKDDETKRHIVARQLALEQEKERAAEVAALPPRDPDPVQDITIPKVKPIKLTDVNAFSSTHLHMPMEEYAVERAQSAEITDAHQAAVEEQERVEAVEEAERVAAHERQEKARLRHKHARQKVLLKQDYDHMLLDLSDLRRSDIARRQQVVAKIPRAVYQAPHRRLEEKEEEQREMEAAFEDMYMAATENQGDLTLALDRHPPPAVTPAGSSALDLSLDPGELEKVPEGQRAPLGAPLKDLTNLQRMAQGKSNVSALGKLMGRIHAQRESWVKQAEPVESPPQRQPMVPLERDLSSTTTGGSLTQYTISSAGTATTLEESTTDVSSVTTQTGSKASSVPLSQRSVTSVTVTDSDITTTTTTTEETLEEGTISSSTSAYSTTMQTDTTANGTLLHPMEIAAKVRQKPLTDSSAPMASFLDQRKLTNQPNLEQLVHDFRQEQQRLEKERKKLEKKMKDLEGQSMKLTPLELAQKYLRELPPVPGEQTQPTPSAAKPEVSIHTSETPMSSSLSQADKVRLYQQRALERRRGRDSSLLGTSMDRSSTVPSTPSPQRSPVGVHSSVMTSPSGALSSISGIPADTSNTQHQLGGSPYSGKSGVTTDLSQQSYHSHDFDARQLALKAQLAEIEQQRAEIQAQQQRYHDEMHQTKERWQRELEQYSLRDSQAAAERSLSLLTVPETQNQSSANQVEGEKEEYTGWVDSDDAIDEDLLRQLNNLPHKAIDHKYKIQRRKPTSKAIKVPNKSPVMPHDLSTIQELDTPITDKKQPMNSTDLESRKDRPSVSRSLFENQMQTVPEVDASDAFDYNSRYAPPNDPYFLAGLGQFEPPLLDQPRTPQQLSQHFTKVPSEVDTLSAGRSEDFADMYGDRNYVGLESKTIERPMPSIDRVQEIERLPDTTPGELVITSPAPPPPPAQDFMEYQGDHTAFSTTLSTGPLVEDSEYHPDSAGIEISYKESVPRTEEVQEDRRNDPISTERYSRLQSQEETPPRVEPQSLPRTPTKPYSPTSSSPKFEFTSHYVGLKDQGKGKNWKKELAQYNMSYLTPPKMSPGRPTDKIVRCITTRAFGCERPIKGTAKTKEQMEEKHRANLIPPRDMRNMGINRVISPEENMSPSRIREMFEQSSGSKNPMGSPIPKDKPLRGFIDQSGQFLSSTPSSEKIVSRLRTGEGAASEQGTTPMEPIDRRSLEGSQNWSGSGKYDRPPRTSSFSGNETVTPSERSGQSSLSQYRLDSDADTTKTPANVSVKTDASLEQYPLSASAGRSETTMSLSQYTLEDSRRVSAPGGSPPGSASFARSAQGQGPSTFHPLMEMSRSSDGSARSAHKSPLQSSQAYGMQWDESTQLQLHGQFTDPRTMGAYSVQQKTGDTTDSVHQASTGPSQSVVDLAMDISKKAEAAMEKYDRLMDESRRLREQYEVEEQTLMAEARGSAGQSSQKSEATIEQNLSRSLERLAQEETGISEEPDITLVSVSSTPQKVSPLMPDDDREPTAAVLEDQLVQSQADSKGSDQPRSLLSFEQHEQSLATMSQVSLIRPSLSDGKSSMTSSLMRSGGDTEPLTPYASSSSAGGSSLAASGPRGASSSGAKAGQEPKEERTSSVQENQKHMSRTLASWKKNNALNAPTTNPSDSSSAAASISMTKTSADQKKKEREMKQRTEKLYSQLEDVKQQREEKQRQEDYAANRQRKLEYQKNYQEQLKKKYQDKKK